MSDFVVTWTELLFRWLHVIAAIAWIGHAFMFHSIEHHLRRPELDDVPDDVEGEMWMVHGGGFFRMQKTRVLPPKITGKLKWFKYEALMTWISGFLLFTILFYHGNALLVDPDLTYKASTVKALGLGSIVGGFVLYELIWSSPLARHNRIAALLTITLIAGLTIGLTQVMTGRAAFIHVGALMGTIMTANVWMRIIPGMRRMIAALKRGQEPDFELGRVGKQRSIHNGYMHFPIIFIMISNHFSTAFIHQYNWLVLLLLMVLGIGMRQVLYDGLRTHISVWIAVAASLAAVVYMTAPKSQGGPSRPVTNPNGQPVEPATVGKIQGVVRVSGHIPARQPLSLNPECKAANSTTPQTESILATNGLLKNAFVWIKQGADRWQWPAVPDKAVEIDQVGCVYAPRVAGARVAQDVTFINSDAFYHNVHGRRGSTTLFNLSMPAKDQRLTRKFMRPEVPVMAKCDVHPWMRAYIGIVEHPWFAVSDERGAFTIANVPPGDYVLALWHETLGEQTRTVSVTAKSATSVEFKLVAK